MDHDELPPVFTRDHNSGICRVRAGLGEGTCRNLNILVSRHMLNRSGPTSRPWFHVRTPKDVIGEVSPLVLPNTPRRSVAMCVCPASGGVMPGMGSSGKSSKHGRKKFEKSSLVGLTTTCENTKHMRVAGQWATQDGPLFCRRRS